MKAAIKLAIAAGLFAAGFAQPLFPPIRILGNLYYVGDNDLASYLIVTDRGSILINTGFEFSVPEIRARIEKLGFRFAEIKILLVTHAHSDHAAGLAKMKRLTGAKMLAIEEEAPLLESGGKTDYLFGSSGWFPPVKVDRTFHDGDKIHLGGTELTAHLTPGHTKGSVSYSLEISENGRTYHVLIANLGTINPGTVLLHNPRYPKIAEDYARTFQLQKELPCDVFLASHASQFGLLSKYRPGMPYDPGRFIDPDGYRFVVARLEAIYLRQLEEEREEEQAIRDRLHFKDVIPP
jgi:metallo-beta-lactamase class B